MGNKNNPPRTINETEGLATEPVVLIKRRYRVTADIVVEVRDITPQTVHEVEGRASNYKDIIGEQWVWDHARHQRELLHAIIAKPEALDRLLKEEVAVEAQDQAYTNALRDAVNPDGIDGAEFIRAALPMLSPAAKAHFDEAIKERYYSDATDYVLRSIASQLESVSLIDVTDAMAESPR